MLQCQISGVTNESSRNLEERKVSPSEEDHWQEGQGLESREERKTPVR